ncbi:GNAT family N-acetyltransferase [Aquibacillus saliphilus]|uniref:GNAT family N-acetyltransferase n=1 Tax=Aquibacillus saliphilus TaxID=1909422 RepID=UPI001CEFD474|nr:GNAT family N-acetyltransferase [Aquibacillus saliphilus]
MITKPTDYEMTIIYSKIADSANEGAMMHNKVSIDKAYQIILPILNNGGYYLVYRNPDGKLAGWILIGVDFDLLTEQPHGFIYELYVLPEYRKRGISKFLLNYSIQLFKQQGYQEVRLNVFANNFAENIYKSLGFNYLQSIMSLQT